MNLPLELVEHIVQLQHTIDLKPWMLVSKYFNEFIRKIIRARFPRIQSYSIIPACFQPYRAIELSDENAIFGLVPKYTLEYSFTRSTLKLADSPPIGLAKIRLWSYEFHCYFMHANIHHAMPLFSQGTNAVIIYPKAEEAALTQHVMVWNFFDQNRPALYHYEIPFEFAWFIYIYNTIPMLSPDGTCFFVFNKNYILTYTGHQLPLPKGWTFKSIIFNTKNISWKNGNTCVLDKTEFKENKDMQLQIYSDYYNVLQ